MAQKLMLEATQDVVDGNQVVHAAGELYATPGDVPEGVPVRPVTVDVPDAPKAPAKQPQGKGAKP